MSTQPNHWGWGNVNQVSSNSSQPSIFGSLGIKVNHEPNHLSMGDDSVPIKFDCDCPDIQGANLEVDGQNIGTFSNGICVVNADVLQSFAKDEELLEIEFTLRHDDIEWPLSQFSVDVDWGKPIRAEARFISNWQGRYSELRIDIRTIVPGIFTYQDEFELSVTLLDSDCQEIGGKHSKNFHLFNRREIELEEEDFNLSFDDVYGARIQILNLGTGDVEYDKTKLLKKKKRRLSANLIEAKYWIGEGEVDYTHQVLTQTNDGYEYVDESEITYREIRDLWSQDLNPPLINSIGPHTLELDGDRHKVRVPMELDLDPIILQRSKITSLVVIAKQSVDGEHKERSVTQIELDCDSNSGVFASFRLDAGPGSCGVSIKLQSNVEAVDGFCYSNTEQFVVNLPTLVEKIATPYNHDGVIYFAKGIIGRDSICLNRVRFSDEGATVEMETRDEHGVKQYVDLATPFCPEPYCGWLLVMGKCENPLCGASKFDHIARIIPESIEVKASISGSEFDYGISIDRLHKDACDSFPNHIPDKELFEVSTGTLDRLNFVELTADDLRGKI